MTLAKGTALGPYEIQSLIGAGGMGQVYRARDTRLERDVAIKVLPDQLSSNENLKGRFEREARLISSLNHPNICVLHDIGHSGETDFFVMELVDGETLDERIQRGPLSPEETVALGTQIARALEHAHSRGVVHRDLKPSNIMLTSSGVKLLDFGLSKLLREPEQEDIDSYGATVQRAVTEEGVVLGTLQYMAPEQAEGKPADARTDVFALGAVLYEMVTGRRAFQGKSRASLIAAIMAVDPPQSISLRPDVPPSLDRVIATCLEKDPDDRWQTAHDVRLGLEMTRFSAPAEHGKRPDPLRRLAPWLVAAIALTAAVAALMLGGNGQQPPPGVTFELMPGTKLYDTSDAPVVLSPDGRRLLVGMFEGALGRRSEIHIRDLDGLEFRRIPSDQHVYDASWSWNGDQIVFFSTGGKMNRVAATGGPVTTLGKARDSRGASWGPNGTILFAPDITSPIMQISENGGEPVPVTTLDSAAGDSGHWRPAFLPDGEHFLYLVRSSDSSRSGIHVGSLDGKVSRRLIGTLSAPVFAAPDKVLYHHDGDLYAQKLDMKELKTVGSPVRVAGPVAYADEFANPGFSASRNGVLAWHRLTGSREAAVLRYDREGRQLPGVELTGVNLDLSRDDTRLASMDTASELPDIWIHDIHRDVRTRVTTGGVPHIGPVWSPDGEWIAYTAFNADGLTLYRKRSSGVGDGELILTQAGMGGEVVDWSRDGRYLLIETRADDTNGDLATVDLESERRELRPLIATSFNEHSGRFSPDGRWVVYSADDAGQLEIFVQPFPPDGSRWQISNQGGEAPRWRGDSSELFWINRGGLVAAEIETVPAFRVSEPTVLFKIDSNDYVVDSSGQTFMLSTGGNSDSSPIIVDTTGILDRQENIR